MDENIKKGIRKLAEDAEAGIARSILRWKYKKEGTLSPGDDYLENQSRMIADRAHDVIAKRGRNAWNELKKVYVKPKIKEDADE